MSQDDKFTHISQFPTNPRTKKNAKKDFDISQLYEGPANSHSENNQEGLALDEKLRQAYFWIVNKGIINPFYDIEYNDASPRTFKFGDAKSELNLPSAQSYSSFVLMPLLTFALKKKCLLIGGPGRGKTASAILIGIIGGHKLKDIKRSIQKGQPQMSITDLLGSPLPSDLVNASDFNDIKIAWRKWLSMDIKIIDEYNRIPTRTQSALLTVMADNYAELYDQIFECPDSAWFLTANDDAGGGTFEVIEALKDRIDVVVKAFHYNSRFLSDLLFRLENGINPEEMVPTDIIFTQEECANMSKEIRSIKIPDALLKRFEFFVSQFEHCLPASKQIEYQTKDTVKLSEGNFTSLIKDEIGLDIESVFGTQTENGLSVRSIMTVLSYVKAMAYFRGSAEVELEDFNQTIPFILHDKLKQFKNHKIFQQESHKVYQLDHISWIRDLFKQSCLEYDRLNRDVDDRVGKLLDQMRKGLDGVSAEEVNTRIGQIESLLSHWQQNSKFYPHMFDDILSLKYLHQRYSNYLAWLKWQT